MVTALVLAGGSGARVGSNIPKQYQMVGGHMVIYYCLKTLFEDDNINQVVIAAHHLWRGVIDEEISQLPNSEKFIGYTKPGETRQLSILNCLLELKLCGSDNHILIHDAARPCVSHELISDIVNAVDEHDGVMPVLPMKDTVYRLGSDGSVESLLDRSVIYAGQAPELFQVEKYFEANQQLMDGRIEEINGSTEPAIMYGMDIVTVLGQESNFKITTKEDLERFRRIVEERTHDESPSAK